MTFEPSRRSFFAGAGAFIACAPAIVRASSLMLIKPLPIVRALPTMLLVRGFDQFGHPIEDRIPIDRMFHRIWQGPHFLEVTEWSVLTPATV